MSKIDKVYEAIRRQNDASIDLAIASALPTADDQAVARLSAILAERGKARGKTALIEQFHRLPPEVRRQILADLPNYGEALRRIARSRESQPCMNIVRTVRQACDHSLAYLASQQLRHHDPLVRNEAALCLLDLGQLASTDPRPGHLPQSPADQVAYLQTVLVEALDRAGDLSPTVVTALLLLAPRKINGAMSVMGKPEHPAGRAIRKLLAEPDHPAIRRAILMLAQSPALAEPVRAALTWTLKEDAIANVLEAGHLLIAPAVSRTLSRLEDPLPFALPNQSPDALPLGAQQHLGRWIAALPLEPYQKIEQLARLSRAAEPATRLGALRQLIRLTGDAHAAHACDAVADFTFDTHEPIARLALAHLVRMRWSSLPQLLPRLVNSVHPAVQQLARRRLAPIAFNQLWRGWTRMTSDQRLAAGRALIKIDQRFHQHLQQKLESPSRGEQVRALQIIHGLNQGPLFEPLLVQLAQSSDKVVAASAVRALGSADSHAAVVATEIALEHDDSRVRANAVEALEQMQSFRHVTRLMDMARSDDARPRANAIRSLLEIRTGDAMNCLTAMLADKRRGQRISALWLVNTLGVIEVARNVAELATRDPDHEVKGRARNVIRQMIDTLSAADAETQSQTTALV